MHFVFDIDDTLISVANSFNKIEATAIEELGAEFVAAATTRACDAVHLVFPGFYALFRWLDARGGKLHFFSSGIELRNRELVPQLIERAFGPQDAARVMEDVTIHSRTDCIDTDRLTQEANEAIQGVFHGNRKKKLVGVVVPAAELPDTLLIDDDSSYTARGEEHNFVHVIGDLGHYAILHNNVRNFQGFHKAFYLAGLLDRVFQAMAERECSLADAAWCVQVEQSGETYGNRFFYPLRETTAWTLEGLALLQTVDPTLRLYAPVPPPEPGFRRRLEPCPF